MFLMEYSNCYIPPKKYLLDKNAAMTQQSVFLREYNKGRGGIKNVDHLPYAPHWADISYMLSHSVLPTAL